MRRILGIYSAPRSHWVGDGFPVRTVISHSAQGEHISPFLMLDYAGPYVFQPALTARGIGEHPHRGFETVTIVYEGEVEHRDSTGEGGVIGPGDVQWMTAASGILHEEFHSESFTKNGGVLEMAQLWVNLPAKNKMMRPGYQAIPDKSIPRVSLPNGAGTLRVIAGEYSSRRGPANTATPINVWDLRLKSGHEVELNLVESHTLAAVVLSGAVNANGEQIAKESEVVLFDQVGGAISLKADLDSKVLILSGQAIGEPVEAYGPFVMNNKKEIRQAIDDFENGRFQSIPA